MTDAPIERQPDPANLSPALAQMSAILLIPSQYASFLSKTVLSVNEKCPSTIRNIDK